MKLSQLIRPIRRVSQIKLSIAATLLACASILGVTGLVNADDPESGLLTRAQSLFSPLPDHARVDDYPHSAERIALGKTLFYEARVSVDNSTSCASCHSAAFHGADPRKLSIGIRGQVLPRNAPTVFNTPLLVSQHYGGNRKTVEDQAMKAVTSPLAYGNAMFEEAEARLRALGYQAQFEAAFPNEKEPLTIENWGAAIGSFERTLLTPAPFDRYLKGERQAISSEAKQGLEKFMNYGCVACHSGTVVGGQSYTKFGITEDYWKATGSTEMAEFKGRDKGRYHDTKNEADTYVFKVPQLRNVTKTAPYFHDGSVASLEDAVKIMARLQLGRTLSDEDTRHIIAFLETLTGDVPKNFANTSTSADASQLKR
jgi:cytochrome c peroxidase